MFGGLVMFEKENDILLKTMKISLVTYLGVMSAAHLITENCDLFFGDKYGTDVKTGVYNESEELFSDEYKAYLEKLPYDRLLVRQTEWKPNSDGVYQRDIVYYDVSEIDVENSYDYANLNLSDLEITRKQVQKSELGLEDFSDSNTIEVIDYTQSLEDLYDYQDEILASRGIIYSAFTGLFLGVFGVSFFRYRFNKRMAKTIEKDIEEKNKILDEARKRIK